MVKWKKMNKKIAKKKFKITTRPLNLSTKNRTKKTGKVKCKKKKDF